MSSEEPTDDVPAVIRSIADLTSDDHNANRGTKRGLEVLETSLEKFGAGRSILVDRNGKIIAGNKSAEAAAEKGFPVRVVQTNGHELVVVQRTDLDMDTDPRARELGIADNRTAELGLDWDPKELGELMEMGVDMTSFFFEDELRDIVLQDPTTPPAGEETNPDAADGKGYQEKLVISLKDITIRGPLTAAVEQIIADNGWADKTYIKK
jgi:hypothetical protein